MYKMLISECAYFGTNRMHQKIAKAHVIFDRKTLLYIRLLLADVIHPS